MVACRIRRPVRARTLGIAAIYQQPALFPDLTVAENIALGLERRGAWRVVRWGERRRRAGGVSPDRTPTLMSGAGTPRRSAMRPMTPTNLPIFGRKRHRNLFFNTGHGHIGWTMSHGSARITADLIAGRAPALSTEALAA